MTYQERLTEILSKYMTRSDSGSMTVTWSNQDVLEEIVAAINALNLETLGEDDPVANGGYPYLMLRNQLRANLRQRFGVSND